MKKANDLSLWQNSAALLLCCTVLLLPVDAPASRRPLIHGICTRPFPAIFQLDYAWCRADAWLRALDNAAARLPPQVSIHLQNLGLDTTLGKLAIASLLFPLDVVTPEKANSRTIRVFLKDAPSHEQLFRDVPRILEQMCIIWETSRTVMAMRALWPQNADADSENLPALEELGTLLVQLWNLESSTPTTSAALLMAEAGAAPGTRESMEKADSALKILLDRSVKTHSEKEKALWNLLSAQALHLRALGHQALGESGLAEMDYTTALTRLQTTPGLMDLKGEIAHQRGLLRQSIGKYGLMCADFALACSAGHCRGLAEARRNGLCADSPTNPAEDTQ